MEHTEVKEELPPVSRGLLQALLYFDIFHYPLKAKEIWHATPYPVFDPTTINNSLEELVSDGYVKNKQGYYYVNLTSGIVENRIRGNALAQKHLATAQPYLRLVASFPFVRGVFLSGSI